LPIRNRLRVQLDAGRDYRLGRRSVNNRERCAGSASAHRGASLGVLFCRSKVGFVLSLRIAALPRSGLDGDDYRYENCGDDAGGKAVGGSRRSPAPRDRARGWPRCGCVRASV